MLKEKGYNIARRTVAKYREQLDIPVARLRKGTLMKAKEFSPISSPLFFSHC